MSARAMHTLRLFADKEAVSTAKIVTAARLAGFKVDFSTGGGRTPCGLAVPELQLPSGDSIRHTDAILRRIAQAFDSSLAGTTFFEEGQVDGWLTWVSLEVDHLELDGMDELAPICKVLETHLKSRTFIVGQRMTLADISAACSLRKPLEAVGLEEIRGSHPHTVRWLLTCVHQLGLASQDPAHKAAPAAAPSKPSAPSAATAPRDADAHASEQAGGGGGKKDEKKKAKEDAKKAKEDEKRRKEEEQLAALEAKHKGPSVTLNDFERETFGTLCIQSERRTDRQWTPVNALDAKLVGEFVWLRARVHGSRKKGPICFLMLRQDLAMVQAVVMGKELSAFAGALSDESVVDVFGKVVCPEIPLTSSALTQGEVEVSVEKLFCVGRAQPLPLQLEDAARPEAEYEKDPALVRVNQDVRLDHRVIDLRTVANQAIFRIQSGVCTLFREYLLRNSFQEIHTPKLIAGASEGGADVFRVDYFEGNAYLAQSPQLYKQMALMTDMPRVFEIGPVFRSEKSFTHRHMTEFTGLDLEMTFMEHYHEVLDMIDGLFNHIFKGLHERFARELDAVRKQYPFEDLIWKHPCKRLTFKEAIGLLRSKGPAVLEEKLNALEPKTDAQSSYEKDTIKKHIDSVKAHEDEEDISTEDEKVIGVIMHKDFGEDLYIIDKFPKDTRPFYTMPDPTDNRWTNAYDVFLRGEEITSGAQRIHDPRMLMDKVTAMGIQPDTIQSYIDAFKYGSYPHAGAGIGMERVVMLFMGLSNIRKSSMFPRDPKRLTP